MGHDESGSERRGEAGTPASRITEAADALQAHRERPCLVLVDPTIDRTDLLRVRAILGDAGGDSLDVVLYSNGGDIDGAYTIARELRRRFDRVAVFVPLRAKSAATLICLCADELVLGDLGELGPLDAQCDERREADFPLNTSRLALFKSLEQLQELALDAYEEAVRRIVNVSGMRPFDAGTKAAEITTSLYGPIYAKIDPIRVAESARGLEVGSAYAVRMLRRYRPDIASERAHEIVHRLIHAYPSHGFVIDAEELRDLGLPARPADAEERPILDALARALVEHGDAHDVVVFSGGHPERAAARGPREASIPGAVESVVAVDDAGRRPRATSTAAVDVRHHALAQPRVRR